MINIGQLVREYATEECAILLGFGTYKRTVIAAKEWGEKMQRMYVAPAVDGSLDNIIHKQRDGCNVLVIFGSNNQRKSKELLTQGIRAKGRRGQRAIGVVYNPEYERYGNYVATNLAKRYDIFLHIDTRHALHPVHTPDLKEDEELPETFPTGL